MEALTKNSAHSLRRCHCQSARQSGRRKEGGAGRRANDVADRVMTFPCRLPACLSSFPRLCLIRVSCWKRKCLLFNCFVLSCFAWLQLFEELVARQEAISCKCNQRYCTATALKKCCKNWRPKFVKSTIKGCFRLPHTLSVSIHTQNVEEFPYFYFTFFLWGGGSWSCN